MIFPCLRVYLICSLLVCAALFGCSTPRPATDPAADAKARAIATDLESFNQSIFTAKGTCTATLHTPESIQAFTIAWAAAFPDKLRMTLLMSGHAVETIVFFQDTLSLFSHTGRHDLFLDYGSDPDLERYLQVPLKTSTLIRILLGRLPVQDFDDAYLSVDNPDVTILRSTPKRFLQAVVTDSSGRLEQLRLETFSQKSLYTMTIHDYQTHGAHTIPGRIEIADNRGRTLKIQITGFDANPPLKPGIFQLTEPGS